MERTNSSLRRAVAGVSFVEPARVTHGHLLKSLMVKARSLIAIERCQPAGVYLRRSALDLLWASAFSSGDMASASSSARRLATSRALKSAIVAVSTGEGFARIVACFKRSRILRVEKRCNRSIVSMCDAFRVEPQ